MPAKNLRRVSEGGTYCHVYNKGIENRLIFADDSDYLVFLDFLEEYLSAPNPQNTKKDFTVNGRTYKGVPHQPKNYLNKIELIAYCLKPDHFHLILHQKRKKSLQGFIRSLSTRYSIYFNKKYGRTGPLFEGPYKSAAISDEKSLLHLTRHLHKDTQFSSFPEYLGTKTTPWVKTKAVLSVNNSVRNYHDFVEKYKPNETELTIVREIAIESLDNHLERRDIDKMAKKPTSRLPELIAAGALFVLLAGFGIRNINTSAKKTATLGTKIILASPSPSPDNQNEK